MCEFCGKEAIAAKSHDFKGDYVVTKSGHGKKCTNGGCSVSEEEKPHFAEPDGDCTTDDICECGYFVTEAKASHDFGKWVSTGDGTHTRRCLSEGCTAGVETEGCFGGRANCVEKAVCEGCAASYGQIDEKITKMPSTSPPQIPQRKAKETSNIGAAKTAENIFPTPLSQRKFSFPIRCSKGLNPSRLRRKQASQRRFSPRFACFARQPL